MAIIFPTIPYKSQFDTDASQFRNDCGPACLAMILNAFGTDATTNAVFRRSGADAENYVSVSQLMRAGESYGVPFRYFYGWNVKRLV